MMAFLLAAATNTTPNLVEVSLDRTLATILGTFVLFLIGQLIVAIKWGSKINTIVEVMMKRLDTLTAEVGEIKASLSQLASQQVRLEDHSNRLQDHDSRIRTLERGSWQNSSDRG